MESTVFLRRKRCFPMEKTIFLSCAAMLSVVPLLMVLRTTLFSALLPPATYLPPPSKCLIYSGLSGVGGRVAANRIKKTITHRLCPPYIGAIHRSQYKGMFTKLTGMPYSKSDDYGAVMYNLLLPRQQQAIDYAETVFAEIP